MNIKVDSKPIEQMNVVAAIFLNELETIVEQVATDKEFCIFWILAEGKAYKEVGRIFGV